MLQGHFHDEESDLFPPAVELLEERHELHRRRRIGGPLQQVCRQRPHFVTPLRPVRIERRGLCVVVAKCQRLPLGQSIILGCGNHDESSGSEVRAVCKHPNTDRPLMSTRSYADRVFSGCEYEQSGRERSAPWQ